ncbi:MAG TPA: hypothetical protein VJO53_05580 [Candidatus Acidoferrales bacterium]|nr:hypothetical protein [Candidatus Acidoferrales bacterium]
MGVKVKEGTPMSSPSLCETCSRAHIARGYRETEVVVICDALYRDHPVLFPVRECTHYLDKNRQDLEEMEEIAWVLAPRDGKRVAGFVRLVDLPEEADEAEIELDALK